jgi:GNAT superfamily N-acetyltransferase
VHNYRGGVVPDEVLDRITPAQFARLFSAQEARTNSETWVAEPAGQTRGFVQFGRSRDADIPSDGGEVYAIFVEPEAQGTGLGRLLIERALARLAEQGYGAPTLWVLESNVQARRFYERGGWELDAGRKAIPVGRHSLATVRYRLGSRDAQ